MGLFINYYFMVFLWCLQAVGFWHLRCYFLLFHFFFLQVTRHMSQVNPPALDSIIEFYLTFSKEVCSGVTMLRLNMYPTVGAKEFTCFFTFLSAFIAKVVDKSFSISVWNVTSPANFCGFDKKCIEKKMEEKFFIFFWTIY